ncbi:MAG TPA: hypothetical protein VGR15_07135 [Bacteroidota bacterium]|nr:hypothetical protein [Bacteroidota bacterium]
MSNESFDRAQRIYDGIKPLATDILECFRKQLTIVECVDFLIKKKPILAVDFDTDGEEFLNEIRKVMFETLSQQDQSHAEFLSAVVYGGNFAGSPLPRETLKKYWREKEP